MKIDNDIKKENQEISYNKLVCIGSGTLLNAKSILQWKRSYS